MIRELCVKYTNLNSSDVEILQSTADHLPAIAALTGNDIFIDTLTMNGKDSVVLAWAHPCGKSLYRDNIVGQLALVDSEPAVYKTITVGEISKDIRGITQEGIPVSQTISAIRNQTGQIIGVLIMERNITKHIWQEEQVAFLSQTVEHLSDTLMYLSMTESTFEAWLANGLFILNKNGKIIYANKHAAKLIESNGAKEAVGSDLSIIFPECITLSQLLDKLQDSCECQLSFYSFR